MGWDWMGWDWMGWDGKGCDSGSHLNVSALVPDQLSQLLYRPGQTQPLFVVCVAPRALRATA